VVALPDGRRIRGRALRDGAPHGQEVPEFGVYLTARPRHEEGWESRWVCWPDFWVPQSPSDAVAALELAFDRSRVLRVEIACGGGTGRTGTAIAILAHWAGIPANDAVAWTRANYRPRAVETPWQRRFALRAELGR
jgi:protein-tyrosine phosphatase